MQVRFIFGLTPIYLIEELDCDESALEMDEDTEIDTIEYDIDDSVATKLLLKQEATMQLFKEMQDIISGYIQLQIEQPSIH